MPERDNCADSASWSAEVNQAWSNWPPEGVETHHTKPMIGFVIAAVAGCLAVVLIYRILNRK